MRERRRSRTRWASGADCGGPARSSRSFCWSEPAVSAGEAGVAAWTRTSRDLREESKSWIGEETAANGARVSSHEAFSVGLWDLMLTGEDLPQADTRLERAERVGAKRFAMKLR